MRRIGEDEKSRRGKGENRRIRQEEKSRRRKRAEELKRRRTKEQNNSISQNNWTLKKCLLQQLLDLKSFKP